MSFQHATRAFRSRNYRLYFAGQGISIIGTWMTRVATSWLVYRLTGSAALLGVVGFSGQIPMFFLGPFAGVWVDRWNRRTITVITQVLSMVQSLALAVLVLANVITVWEIVALSLMQGFISAFDLPARQSLVIQMVEDRNALPNAIALSSSMVNAGRLIGPAIAGMLVAAVGEGYCFLIDGFSYIAVIVSLLMMRIVRPAPVSKSQAVLHQMMEGWRYVARSVPIRSILLNLACASLFAMPYSVLMPVFAAKILGAGPNTLGFLMSAIGVGALCGAILLAVRKSAAGLAQGILFATGLFGAALIAFSMSHTLWLSLVLLPFAGFGMMQLMASSNTVLQTIVDDEKRGRVMALYAMAFQGMLPFGSLAAGSIAQHYGAPTAVLASGIACSLIAVWFATRLPAIRAAVDPIQEDVEVVSQPPGPDVG